MNHLYIIQNNLLLLEDSVCQDNLQADPVAIFQLFLNDEPAKLKVNETRSRAEKWIPLTVSDLKNLCRFNFRKDHSLETNL